MYKILYIANERANYFKVVVIKLLNILLLRARAIAYVKGVTGILH